MPWGHHGFAEQGSVAPPTICALHCFRCNARTVKSGGKSMKQLLLWQGGGVSTCVYTHTQRRRPTSLSRDMIQNCRQISRLESLREL